MMRQLWTADGKSAATSGRKPRRQLPRTQPERRRMQPATAETPTGARDGTTSAGARVWLDNPSATVRRCTTRTTAQVGKWHGATRGGPRACRACDGQWEPGARGGPGLRAQNTLCVIRTGGRGSQACDRLQRPDTVFRIPIVSPRRFHSTFHCPQRRIHSADCISSILQWCFSVIGCPQQRAMRGPERMPPITGTGRLRAGLDATRLSLRAQLSLPTLSAGCPAPCQPLSIPFLAVCAVSLESLLPDFSGTRGRMLPGYRGSGPL